MKSKSIFLMAVSLGFGLVAAIGITQVMGRNNQPAPVVEEPKSPILIAVTDININDELLPEMFEERQYPSGLVPENAITSLEQLEGMSARARIGKGEDISLNNIVETTKVRTKKIPVGFKVIGINLGADDHLNGILEAGDLVDIMAIIRNGSRNSGSARTQTFLRKVTVWSIGSKTTRDIEENTNGRGSTVVGLLVTEKQSEKIVLAERTAELRLTLRGEVDGDASTRSEGTLQAEILDNTGENAANLANLLAQQINGGNQPQQPVATAAPAPVAVAPAVAQDVHTMKILSSEGATIYHFNTGSGKIRREGGYEEDSPADEGSGEKDLDFLDDKDELDFSDEGSSDKSDSLIESLDSEPQS